MAKSGKKDVYAVVFRWEENDMPTDKHIKEWVRKCKKPENTQTMLGGIDPTLVIPYYVKQARVAWVEITMPIDPDNQNDQNLQKVKKFIKNFVGNANIRAWHGKDMEWERIKEYVGDDDGLGKK